MTHTPDPTSTFTPRLGLEKARKLTFRGSWADLVNDNLDLIDADTKGRTYGAQVYLDGDEVAAIDGAGARIATGTAGTDDATVIAAAIARLNTGGRLLIRDGTYTIPAAIPWSYSVLNYNVGLYVNGISNLTIHGESRAGTVLKLAAGQHDATHNALLLFAYGADHLEIGNLTLDGNKANQTYHYFDGAGLMLTGGTRSGCFYHDLELRNSAGYSLYLGNIAAKERHAIVRDIYSHDNSQNITLDGPERILAHHLLIVDDGLENGSRTSFTMTGGPDYATRTDANHVSGLNIIGGGLVVNNQNTVTLSDIMVDLSTNENSINSTYIYNAKNIFVRNLQIAKAVAGYGLTAGNVQNLAVSGSAIKAYIGISTTGATTLDARSSRISSNGRVAQVSGAGNVSLLSGVTLDNLYGGDILSVLDGAAATLIGCDATSSVALVNAGTLNAVACVNIEVPA